MQQSNLLFQYNMDQIPKMSIKEAKSFDIADEKKKNIFSKFSGTQLQQTYLASISLELPHPYLISGICIQEDEQFSDSSIACKYFEILCNSSLKDESIIDNIYQPPHANSDNEQTSSQQVVNKSEMQLDNHQMIQEKVQIAAITNYFKIQIVIYPKYIDEVAQQQHQQLQQQQQHQHEHKNAQENVVNQQDEDGGGNGSQEQSKEQLVGDRKNQAKQIFQAQQNVLGSIQKVSEVIQKRVKCIQLLGFALNESPPASAVVPLLNICSTFRRMKKSEETVECEIMLGIALTSARRNQQAVEILKRASAYFELKHHQYMSNPTIQQKLSPFQHLQQTWNEVAPPSQTQNQNKQVVPLGTSHFLNRAAKLQLLIAEAVRHPSQAIQKEKVTAFVKATEFFTGINIITRQNQRQTQNLSQTQNQNEQESLCAYSQMLNLEPHLSQFLMKTLNEDQEPLRVAALHGLEHVMELLGCTLGATLPQILSTVLATYPPLQQSQITSQNGNAQNQIDTKQQRIQRIQMDAYHKQQRLTQLLNSYHHFLEGFQSVVTSASSHLLRSIFTQNVLPHLFSPQVHAQPELLSFLCRVAEKVVSICQGDLSTNVQFFQQMLHSLLCNQSIQVRSVAGKLWDTVKHKLLANLPASQLNLVIEYVREQLESSQLLMMINCNNNITLQNEKDQHEQQAQQQQLVQLLLDDRNEILLAQLMAMVQVVCEKDQKGQQVLPQQAACFSMSSVCTQELNIDSLEQPILRWLEKSLAAQSKTALFKQVWTVLSDVNACLALRQKNKLHQEMSMQVSLGLGGGQMQHNKFQDHLFSAIPELRLLELLMPTLHKIHDYQASSSPTLQMLNFLITILNALLPLKKNKKYAKISSVFHAFLIKFMDVFLDCIPHSIHDETFVVFDLLLQHLYFLLTPAIIDKAIHALLDQYSVKGKAQKSSVNGFIEVMVNGQQQQNSNSNSKLNQIENPPQAYLKICIDCCLLNNPEPGNAQQHSKIQTNINNMASISKDSTMLQVKETPPSSNKHSFQMMMSSEDNIVSSPHQISSIMYQSKQANVNKQKWRNSQLMRKQEDSKQRAKDLDMFREKLSLCSMILEATLLAQTMNPVSIAVFEALLANPQLQIILLNLVQSSSARIRLKGLHILKLLFENYQKQDAQIIQQRENARKNNQIHNKNNKNSAAKLQKQQKYKQDQTKQKIKQILVAAEEGKMIPLDDNQYIDENDNDNDNASSDVLLDSKDDDANKNAKANKIEDDEMGIGSQFTEQRLQLATLMLKVVTSALTQNNGDPKLQFNTLLLIDSLYQTVLAFPPLQSELERYFAKQKLFQIQNSKSPSINNTNQNPSSDVDIFTFKLPINEQGQSIPLQYHDDIYLCLRIDSILSLLPHMQALVNSSWSNIRSIIYGILCYWVKPDFNHYNKKQRSKFEQQIFVLIMQLLTSKESECRTGGLNIMGSLNGLGYNFEVFSRDLQSLLSFFRRYQSVTSLAIWEVVFEMQFDWDVTNQAAAVALIQLCAPKDQVYKFFLVKQEAFSLHGYSTKTSQSMTLPVKQSDLFWVQTCQSEDILEIISMFRNEYKPPQNLWIERLDYNSCEQGDLGGDGSDEDYMNMLQQQEDEFLLQQQHNNLAETEYNSNQTQREAEVQLEEDLGIIEVDDEEYNEYYDGDSNMKMGGGGAKGGKPAGKRLHSPSQQAQQMQQNQQPQLQQNNANANSSDKLRPHNPLLRPLTPPIKKLEQQQITQKIPLNNLNMEVPSNALMDPKMLYEYNPDLYNKMCSFMQHIYFQSGGDLNNATNIMQPSINNGIPPSTSNIQQQSGNKVNEVTSGGGVGFVRRRRDSAEMYFDQIKQQIANTTSNSNVNVNTCANQQTNSPSTSTNKNVQQQQQQQQSQQLAQQEPNKIEYENHIQIVSQEEDQLQKQAKQQEGTIKLQLQDDLIEAQTHSQSQQTNKNNRHKRPKSEPKQKRLQQSNTIPPLDQYKQSLSYHYMPNTADLNGQNQETQSLSDHHNAQMNLKPVYDNDDHHQQQQQCLTQQMTIKEQQRFKTEGNDAEIEDDFLEQEQMLLQSSAISKTKKNQQSMPDLNKEETANLIQTQVSSQTYHGGQKRAQQLLLGNKGSPNNRMHSATYHQQEGYQYFQKQNKYSHQTNSQQQLPMQSSKLQSIQNVIKGNKLSNMQKKTLLKKLIQNATYFHQAPSNTNMTMQQSSTQQQYNANAMNFSKKKSQTEKTQTGSPKQYLNNKQFHKANHTQNSVSDLQFEGDDSTDMQLLHEENAQNTQKIISSIKEKQLHMYNLVLQQNQQQNQNQNQNQNINQQLQDRSNSLDRKTKSSLVKSLSQQKLSTMPSSVQFQQIEFLQPNKHNKGVSGSKSHGGEFIALPNNVIESSGGSQAQQFQGKKKMKKGKKKQQLQNQLTLNQNFLSEDNRGGIGTSNNKSIHKTRTKKQPL